jgi:predicted GIY-YIG superfamily endonuclease
MNNGNNSEWTMLNPDFSIDDVPECAAFVYLIQFPDTGDYYIGVKQTYKGLKDIKKRSNDTKDSNWPIYTSSSKVVNQYICEGHNYKKQILWCFPTVQQAMNCETALISLFGTQWDCLNKAIMTKSRLHKDNGEQFKIIQEIVGWLS